MGRGGGGLISVGRGRVDVSFMWAGGGLRPHLCGHHAAFS